MALQAQAQLLDELMGKYRNVAPGDKVSSVRYDDEDVCKYYLCGFCPHDLFVNTKADLGPCNKIHDDELRRQYEKSSRIGRCGFEDDFERFLKSLLMDVEKKIKRGNERLKLTQTVENNAETQEKRARVEELKEKINTLIKQAESLGEAGNVDEAQKTLESCEKFKTECKMLEMQLDSSLHGDQKQMEVCEVCGSFLIVNDAQSRVEEHISGKQHMGYAKVRAALEELRKKRQEEYEKREKERGRDKERGREGDKDRRRESDTKKREEVSSSSSKHSHRDRSRDKSRRSRSRDNHSGRRHSSRSRSRSRRDRERSKRSRSKDRRRSGRNGDNHHRSRSRDRGHDEERNGDKRMRVSKSENTNNNNKDNNHNENKTHNNNNHNNETNEQKQNDEIKSQ